MFANIDNSKRPLPSQSVISCDDMADLSSSLAGVCTVIKDLAQKKQSLRVACYNKVYTPAELKELAASFSLFLDVRAAITSKQTKNALKIIKASGVSLGRREGSKNSTYKLDPHKQQILQMLDEGVPKTKIAKILGTNRFAIYDSLKRWGSESV